MGNLNPKDIIKWTIQMQTGHLNLSHMELSSIPEEIKDLTRLEHLNLNNNNLTEVPEVIRHLKNLKVLFLGNNEIKVLPEWIGELTSLSTLDIENNKIEELPASLSKLKNLQHHGNPLAPTLGNLEVLSGYFYQKKKGHSEFKFSLQEESAIKAFLIALERINVAKKEKDTFLDLSNLGLTQVPDIFQDLPIEAINLYGNELEEVPAFLQEIKSLECLEISKNKITILPDWLKQIPFLAVADNPLEVLPAWAEKRKKKKQHPASHIFYDRYYPIRTKKE